MTTPADRALLEDLLVRYTFAMDRWGEDFTEIFTEDAVLDGPTGHYEGVEGIREFTRRHRRGIRFQPRHVLSNVLISGDGDTATIKAYFTMYYTERELAPPKRVRTSELLYVGTYECEAVRRDGRWRLRRRVVTADAR